MEWNKNITEKLLEGACNTLEKHGVKPENIVVKRVPGSFELTFGAKKIADNWGKFNAISPGLEALHLITFVPALRKALQN